MFAQTPAARNQEHEMDKVKVTTRTGQEFFVQVESSPGGGGEVITRSGDNRLPAGSAMGRDPLGQTETMFSRAVGVVRSVSEELSTALVDCDPRPSEVQLGLDLGFDAGGNVWILKGSASASLRLQLKWQLPASEPAGQAGAKGRGR